MFTSDVQHDPQDKAAAEEYRNVYNVVKKISDDPSSSPLVLK